jgi:hypothetical protein
MAAQGVAVTNGKERPLPFMREQNPMGIDALTPQEKAFLEAEILDAHAAGQMSWRYEALNVLLWALSIGPNHLSSAGKTVDVNALSECVLEIGRDRNRKLDLRPAAEILDALDLT